MPSVSFPTDRSAMSNSSVSVDLVSLRNLYKEDGSEAGADTRYGPTGVW
ncbi:hypothetical protein BH09CHL1_BH09CHL1_07260 [soil metagenome]